MANSTYPKVAVQLLNQALCFYQSLCLVDSEVLRNPPPRQAANRSLQAEKPPHGQAHLVFADTPSNAKKTKRACPSPHTRDCTSKTVRLHIFAPLVLKIL